MMMQKELRRNEQEGMIGGVCAGLGEYFEIDKTWVRLFFVLSIFFSFFGVGIVGPFLYLLIWVIVPRKPFVFPDQPDAYQHAGERSNVRESYALNNKKRGKRDRNTAGILLIGIGVLFLVIQLDIISWSQLFRFWPIAFVLMGIYVISSSFYPKQPKKAEMPMDEEFEKVQDKPDNEN